MTKQSGPQNEIDTDQPALDRSAFAVFSSLQRPMQPLRLTGYPALRMSVYATWKRSDE